MTVTPLAPVLPTRVEHAAQIPALTDRIIVGNHDITWLRGRRTPTPSYTLIEPFGYGSGRLPLPQVDNRENEKFGVPGELSWLHPGAQVRLQRLDAQGDVAVTDYLGTVMGVNLTGAYPSLTLGGILAGPASQREKMAPVYRRVRDLGRWAFDGIEHSGNYAGVHFTPTLGPVTGIEISEAGGMSQLDWLQSLCTFSLGKSGNVKTIMPISHGKATFEMRDKDLTTVDFTLYLGARVSADLAYDASEHPNVYYASGTEPSGAYYDGSVYPNVEPGTAPDFPGILQQGDSGDDVLTLCWKLVRDGYLTRGEVDDDLNTFDADVTDAVTDAQEAAGLDETGVVDKDTWEAIFDVSAKNWSLSGARIEPYAQGASVRPWNYSGTGALIGPNPRYNPHKLRVDRALDFGAGITEHRARGWCHGMLIRTADPSYVGTVTMHGVAAIAGRHDYGDPPPTAADVMSARDIRAGMNVWLPDLQGGTLLHVGQVDVDPGQDTSADTVTLTIDPHARDAVELKAAIDHRRDSRRSPRRAWVHTQRHSTQVHDSKQPFNKKAGLIWQKRPCKAQQWTGFWIFAGYGGALSKLRVVTDDAQAPFCMAIFADKVSDHTMDRRIPDPWTVDKNGETKWATDGALSDWYDDRLLLYVAGQENLPCGYWRRKHTNGSGKVTDAPVTGIWQDDASFNYVTLNVPALWVTIWPHVDTVIQRGRMLWTQLDNGT